MQFLDPNYDVSKMWAVNSVAKSDERKNGDVAFEIDKKQITPPEVSAHVLRKLKIIWLTFLGCASSAFESGQNCF